MRPRSLSRNSGLALGLLLVVGGMVGMAYAAVPLYDLFCEVTGYGGTTRRAEAADGRSAERRIIVRFDANVVGLPWTFRPAQPELTVQVGEVATVVYVAENRSDRAATGTATFNVAPGQAGPYFNKLECFCFTEQTLQPGERVEMPVQFFVSADMAEDRAMRPVRAITLSYTFFPVAAAGQPVARSAGATADENM